MKNILCDIIFLIFINNLFAQIPTQNLQFWVKADSVEIINGKVTKWYDLSVNGYHLTQNIDSKKPIQDISILNNLPVLTFDGNDFLCVNFGNEYTQPCTIFTIWKTNNNSQQTIIDNLTDQYTFLDNLRGLGVRLFAGNEVSYTKVNPFDFILTTGVYNFTNSKLYENDILKKTGNVGNKSVFGFCIGYRSGFNDRYFNGSVAEIIFYDTLLCDSSIHAINQYLMDKYAPQINLPADTILTSFCPFVIKSNPPAYFTSYLWSTGDTTDSIIVSSSGLYSVSATDIFGRVSSDSIRVYYLSTGLPIDTFICIHDSLNLQSTLPDSLFSFTWSTGDTTPNITIHSQGEYALTITDLSGCSKTYNISVDEDSFAINSSLGPDTSLCKYDFLSLHATSLTDSILWSDGSTNDRISVDSSGQYWVYAINNHGCEIRDTVYINIKGERPHIIPHYSTACDGYPVLLSDYSAAVPPDQIANSIWIIGYDTISSQNTNYIFSNAGDHNIYLKVVTDSLCWADTSFTIHVFANPVAEFTPLEGCQHDTIHFTSLSSSTDGAITSYQWTISDSLYFGSEINKSFADTGEYEISHYVSTEHGCHDSIKRYVQIKLSPIVDFDYTNSCQGDFIIFNSNIEYPPYYSVINTLWDFGDGESSTIANPSHIYSSAGSYMVSFSAKLINGCENKIIKIIDVYPKPTADFTYDSACINKPAIFINTTANATSSIWYINNDYFNGTSVEYLFPDTGAYEVYLFTTNEYECKDTALNVVRVYPVPFASINIDPEYGNPPLDVIFSTNSIGTNYFWDLGDMNTGIGTNIIHTYSNAGIYNVYMVVSNEYSCSDTAYGTVSLLPSVLDLQILAIDFIDSISLWQPQLIIYNNSTRPVKKMQIDFGFDNFNEFVYLWNQRLEIGQIERIKLPLLLNSNDKQSSFCTKITAIDVIDQNDVSIDDNFLCASLSDSLYIMKLFNNDNYLNLWINTPSEGRLSCKVVNILGQTLFSSDVIDTSVGMNKYKIPTNNLSTGIYILQINYDDKILTRIFYL